MTEGERLTLLIEVVTQTLTTLDAHYMTLSQVHYPGPPEATVKRLKEALALCSTPLTDDSEGDHLP